MGFQEFIGLKQKDPKKEANSEPTPLSPKEEKIAELKKITISLPDDEVLREKLSEELTGRIDERMKHEEQYRQAKKISDTPRGVFTVPSRKVEEKILSILLEEGKVNVGDVAENLQKGSYSLDDIDIAVENVNRRLAA